MKNSQFTLKGASTSLRLPEQPIPCFGLPGTQTRATEQLKLDPQLASTPAQSSAISQDAHVLKGGANQMAETESKNDKPAFKLKLGCFDAAIFLHEIEGRQVPSVVVEKSFTKDGKTWNRQKMTLLNATEIDKCHGAG